MNAMTTPVALAVLSLTLSASGAGEVWFNWQKYGVEYSGYINDQNHWNKDPSTSTAAKDYMQFSLDGSDYTVTIPGNTVYETMMRPFLVGKTGYRLTIDGRNATWLQPVSTHENYNALRMQFRLTAVDVANSDIFCVQQSNAGTAGGFRFTDAMFTLDGTVASNFLLDFTRGTYNFLDPNGTALTTQYLCLNGTKPKDTGDALHDAIVRFGPDSSFTAYKLHYGNLGANRTFLIDGGTGSIDAGGITFIDATSTGMSHLMVTNGGTLSIAGNVVLDSRHPFRMQVESGATLVIPASKTFSFGSASGQDAYDGLLVVSNATFSGGTDSTFKPYGKSRFCKADVSVPTFWPCAETVLSGSCVNVKTAKASSTAISRFEDGCVVNMGVMNGCNAQDDACTYIFKDSIVTSATDDVKFGTSIVVDGGRYVSTNTTCRFNYSGTGASLVLTNGGEYAAIANAVIYFAQGGTASSSLLVCGGKFISNASSADFRWGANGGSGTGRVELVSGEIDVVNRPLIVGKVGYGRQMEMLVSGGKYTGKSMFFTSAANSTDKVSYLRQTGGEIVLSGGFHAVTNYPGRTSLKLEGGTFTAASVYGGLGATVNGGAGYAMLEANGGTLIPSASPDAAGFIRGFDSAKIGVNGLVVDASSDILIPQAFADIDGENGELVLAGSATKTLSGSSTVSKIVAAGGRVAFADGQSTTSSLLVTNGAEVAFESSAAGSSISGVTFGDDSSAGVLVATPGVTPAINGTVDAVNLRVKLANGFSNHTTNAIISAGAFTERSLDTIARAVASAGLPAGAAASFAVEDVAGRKVLKMALADPEVLVIRVDEGTSNIASAVTYPVSGQLQTIVAACATLDISGNVGYGSLLNSGDGVLRLSGGNAFYGEIVSAGGTFSASPLSSLSCGDSVENGTFTLQSGTLELSDTASPVPFPRELRTNPGNDAVPVVIKTDTDVVIEDARCFADSGTVVKRGAGTLTISTSASSLPLDAERGTLAANQYPKATDTMSFGADGKPYGTCHAAFNLIEGGVELQGLGNAASFASPYPIAIGFPCQTGTATPYMSVRDATFNFSWILLGGAITADNSFISGSPYFHATNATVTLDTYAVAYGSALATMKPKTTLDASSLSVAFILRANAASQNNGVETEFSLVNGSTLTSPRIGVQQKATFDCDSSTIDVNELFCKTASYAKDAGYVFADSYAIFRFRNGSLFKTDYIEPSRSASTISPLTFDFDDSEWIPKTGQDADYVFAFTNAFNLLVKAGAGGLILSPGEGRTWSVVHPVTGADGKIVKRGAGTLAFTGNGALAVGGTNEVEAGIFAVSATSTVYGVKAHLAAGTTLDLLEGTHTGAVVSGAGNVRNGTLADAALSVEADGDAEVPILSFDDGLALANTLVFDLGRTADNPAEVGVGMVVCRYTGTPAANIRYKVSGTGLSGSRAEFTVEGGTISAVIRPPRGVKLTFK